MSPHSKSLSNPTNSSANNGWRELYRAAILELDKTQIPPRITQAENAIAGRSRELFDEDGVNAEEKQALDDALYFLQALRSTLLFDTISPYLGKDQGIKAA